MADYVNGIGVAFVSFIPIFAVAYFAKYVLSQCVHLLHLSLTNFREFIRRRNFSFGEKGIWNIWQTGVGERNDWILPVPFVYS